MNCTQIANCEERVKHPKTSLIDPLGGKSNYRLENPTRKPFYKLEFEGCVFKSQPKGKRCDYGWVEKTKDKMAQSNKVVFIELKGGNVKEAAEQVLATILATENCFKGYKKMARLIYSGKYRPKFSRNSKPYKSLAEKVDYNVNADNLITRNRFFEEAM